MLVDMDSWPREYQACVSLNETVISQLLQWEKCESSSSEFHRLTAVVQVGIKQFDTEINQLDIKLNASKNLRNIPQDEIMSRQRGINTLQALLSNLEGKYKKILKSGNHFRSKSQAAVLDITDINALRQDQVDILERQNRSLEILSETISRQRSLASQLGQEVENQNGILSDLANTMERVDVHVYTETGNISDVNRKDAAGYYWIVIIVLFIAIIVVSVI